MALSDDQLATLKTELDTDPNGLGYTGTSHPDAATLLNAVDAVNQIPNTSIAIHAVRDEIRLAEWEGLTQGKRDMIMLLFGNGDVSIDITNSLLVAQILGVFTVVDAPLTREAMSDLATRDGTRAEVLFGANINVTAADVMEARQL
jgi:hypothetical protein